MLIANHNGERKRAEDAGRGAMGTCPWTGRDVKAHVGLIRQFWAYVGGAPEFDRGYEPESEWHVMWKTAIQDEYCEVIFGENNEHRADILGSNDTVIEIQRSTINIRDSRERVDFYHEHTQRRVVWVVDIQKIWRKTFFLGDKISKTDYKVKWKPIRHWLRDLMGTERTNTFLEFNQSNDKLLHAWIYNKELRVKFITKIEFFNRYMKGVSKPEYVNDPDALLRLLCETQ